MKDQKNTAATHLNPGSCCHDTTIINQVAEDDCCGHNQDEGKSTLLQYLPIIISFLMLLIGILADQLNLEYFHGGIRLGWYLIAYFPVAYPVLKQAYVNIIRGDLFTEFFLMGIATVGAFALGHFHEGVAVMLFYTLGEMFQHAAVDKSKKNIRALLDIRPDVATVFRNGKLVNVHPTEVAVGEKIQVKTGEKIPLDGVLLSSSASMNTAAITGESKPDNVRSGEIIYAGSINLENVIELQTTKTFDNSSISRIIHLVQDATSRKSKTELFIRKFARVYTPIVVFLAIALIFLPYFLVADYVFRDWFYRALVFLVISCPCALVISIPLGYFGGLGAASKNGILFKGASFLDTISKVDTVVMDKTGTLTKGVFKITEIKTFGLNEIDFMAHLQALEVQSTHPIAKAIMQHPVKEMKTAHDVQEIAGKGVTGTIEGTIISAGNKKLMEMLGVHLPTEVDDLVESVVFLSIGQKLAGYVVLADELKEDAHQTVANLRKMGIKKLVMLSGDKSSLVEKMGKTLQLDKSIGGLLPEEKLEELQALKAESRSKLAFVGDGINDAPVLAASDVGIAMGGLGSDLAIETADVVIQTDQPSRIATAIAIGRSTRQIVWQNIALAFGVKFIVLLLGAGGMATIWEAVFADVGVAFLAILNAIRLQRMQWD